MTLDELPEGARFTMKAHGMRPEHRDDDVVVKGSRRFSGSWGYYEPSWGCWNETQLYSMKLEANTEVREVGDE